MAEIDSSLSAAGLALGRLGSWPALASLAGLALVKYLKGNAPLGALDRLLEGELQMEHYILPSGWFVRLPGLLPPKQLLEIPEETLEPSLGALLSSPEISEPRKVGESALVPPEAHALIVLLLVRGHPVLIVDLPLLIIRESLVGLCNPGELLPCLRIGVLIRMQLLRLLREGLLDLRLGAALPKTQRLIIVEFFAAKKETSFP